MPRKRTIRPDEAGTWLPVLLDSAFDPATTLTGANGLSQLLALASDFTNYPDDFPDVRRAELLLLWVERWLPAGDWGRLHARVRKRRQRPASRKELTN